MTVLTFTPAKFMALAAAALAIALGTAGRTSTRQQPSRCDFCALSPFYRPTVAIGANGPLTGNMDLAITDSSAQRSYARNGAQPTRRNDPR